MTSRNEYQISTMPVAGPIELERVAKGPFILLTYSRDMVIGKITERQREFLLKQNLSRGNHVLTCHYGIDAGSDRRFEAANEIWKARGVTLERYMVNEIYATSITTRPRLNIKPSGVKSL